MALPNQVQCGFTFYKHVLCIIAAPKRKNQKSTQQVRIHGRAGVMPRLRVRAAKMELSWLEFDPVFHPARQLLEGNRRAVIVADSHQFVGALQKRLMKPVRSGASTEMKHPQTLYSAPGALT